MPARSIWNGCLRVGTCRIPVKLYAAAQDDAVHFHLLHDRDHARVEQRMVNPLSGQALEGKEIHKGYEIKPGTYVLLTQAELAGLEPRASRDIQVLAFVPGSAIQPVWYERPYYLGSGSKNLAYLALARVLEQRGSVGVVRWVFRDEHRRRVLDLIAAKASGKLPKAPPRSRRRADRPLGVALAQSLQRVKKERRSA